MNTPNPLTNQEGAISSPSSPSQYDKCPVCLNAIEDKSVLEGCFHEFCFECIKEWSKVKPVCPLCKQNFLIIIHNIRSDSLFDTFKVVQISASEEQNLSFSISTNIEGLSRFRYRTTMTSDSLFFTLHRERHRLRTLRARMDQLYDRQRLRQEEERLAPPLSSLAFRKLVYQKDLWAQSIGRTNEEFLTHCEYNVTAAFLKLNPACTHRLAPWLNRELLALERVIRRVEKTIASTLATVLELVMRYDIASIEFCHCLRSTFSSETRHFAHELLHFAKSGLEMETYDVCVVYASPKQAWVDTVVSSESESSGTEGIPGPSGSIDGLGATSSSRLFSNRLNRYSSHLFRRQLNNFQDGDASRSLNIQRSLPKRAERLASKHRCAFKLPLLGSDSEDEDEVYDTIRRNRIDAVKQRKASRNIFDSQISLNDRNFFSRSSSRESNNIKDIAVKLEEQKKLVNLNQPSCSRIQNKQESGKGKTNVFCKRINYKSLNKHSLIPLAENCERINGTRRVTNATDTTMDYLSSRFDADIENEVEIIKTEKPWNLRSPISLSSDTDLDNAHDLSKTKSQADFPQDIHQMHHISNNKITSSYSRTRIHSKFSSDETESNSQVYSPEMNTRMDIFEYSGKDYANPSNSSCREDGHLNIILPQGAKNFSVSSYNTANRMETYDKLSKINKNLMEVNSLPCVSSNDGERHLASDSTANYIINSDVCMMDSSSDNNLRQSAGISNKDSRSELNSHRQSPLNFSNKYEDILKKMQIRLNKLQDETQELYLSNLNTVGNKIEAFPCTISNLKSDDNFESSMPLLSSNFLRKVEKQIDTINTHVQTTNELLEMKTNISNRFDKGKPNISISVKNNTFRNGSDLNGSSITYGKRKLKNGPDETMSFLSKSRKQSKANHRNDQVPNYPKGIYISEESSENDEYSYKRNSTFMKSQVVAVKSNPDLESTKKVLTKKHRDKYNDIGINLNPILGHDLKKKHDDSSASSSEETLTIKNYKNKETKKKKVPTATLR